MLKCLLCLSHMEFEPFLPPILRSPTFSDHVNNVTKARPLINNFKITSSL